MHPDLFSCFCTFLSRRVEIFERFESATLESMLTCSKYSNLFYVHLSFCDVPGQMLEVCRFDPAMNCFLCDVLRFWLVLVEDFRHLKPGVTATPTDIDLEAKSLSGIRCCFCLLLAKSKACCVFSYFSARNLRVRHGCIPACFY